MHPHVQAELDKMPNPLLEAWATYPQEPHWRGWHHNSWSYYGGGLYDEEFKAVLDRTALCQRYSWAVPSADAINKIIEPGMPVVEIGAGRGYWARCIGEMGGKVLCFDEYPPNKNKPLNPKELNNWYHPWNRNLEEPTYFPVQYGNERILDYNSFGNYTLFMCWTPMDGTIGKALELFRGERVVIVGEGAGGCTGTHEMHHLLGECGHWSRDEEDDPCAAMPAAKWWLTETLDIPQWFGVNDFLMVYERR